MSRKREDWERERSAWAVALKRCADVADPRLKKCFGSIAWGRYDGEPSPNENHCDVAFGAGFLDGARYALLLVAQEFGLEGENALRTIHRAVNEYKRPRGTPATEGEPSR